MISATSCDILFELSAFGGVISTTASASEGEIKTGVLGAFAGGAVVGHYAIERRKGEEAKQQVFTALRITNHAFEVMNERLQERDKDSQ